MPITFNEADDIWELTDPTNAEKESLTQIAIGEITNFFGGEVANRIVTQAKVFAESQVAKKSESTENLGSKNSFNPGGEGNA